MHHHKTLERIIANAYVQIRAIDKSEMNFKPSENKWSKKEILGHLIDSAYNNHQRFLRAEKKGDLIFDGYDQDEWVRKNNYQNRESYEILSLWKHSNNHLTELIKGLPENILTNETSKHNFHKICMNGIREEQKSSLSYLIWDYIFHTEHHLSQIIPNYEKINREFVTS